MSEQSEYYDLQLNILSTLLVRPEKIDEAAAVLKPEDFFVGTECRTIFETMTALRREDAPVTGTSLRFRLGSTLADFAARELQYAVSDESLTWSLEQLKKGSRLNAINLEGLHLSRAGSQTEADRALARLHELRAEQDRSEIVTISDAVLRYYDRQNQPAPDYLSWGVPELDRHLMISPGDFVVLGGYPSAGKTLLSLQFALEQAKTRKVGYFSLETGVDKLTERILSHTAQLDLSLIKTVRLEDGWDRLKTAATDLSTRSLSLIEAAGMGVSDVAAITRSQDFGVIFLDYLQLLRPDNGRVTRYEQVTGISMDLHIMARQCKCAVIALAQLTRPERISGKPTPPTMNSFRESGQIEQDADAALLLYPSDPENNSAPRLLKLAKNKDGPRCILAMSFDGARQTLTYSRTVSSDLDPRLAQALSAPA